MSIGGMPCIGHDPSVPYKNIGVRMTDIYHNWSDFLLTIFLYLLKSLYKCWSHGRCGLVLFAMNDSGTTNNPFARVDNRGTQKVLVVNIFITINESIFKIICVFLYTPSFVKPWVHNSTFLFPFSFFFLFVYLIVLLLWENRRHLICNFILYFKKLF